jgi:hypothetical protein
MGMNCEDNNYQARKYSDPSVSAGWKLLKFQLHKSLAKGLRATMVQTKKP